MLRIKLRSGLILVAVVALILAPAVRLTKWYARRDRYRAMAYQHKICEYAYSQKSQQSEALDRRAERVHEFLKGLAAHQDLEERDIKRYWPDDNPRYGMPPMAFRPFERPLFQWEAELRAHRAYTSKLRSLGEYHARMRRAYERAAASPWNAAPTDSPEPKRPI